MATNGWIGEQTVHSWGSYNSRLTTNVYINSIRRYSDHIDVSGVIYLFCKSSGARTVWYDWAITAWCGGGNLGQIKPRTYNNNILGKSWSKNFSIRINCSNSATSATFQVGFSDSNMGGKDKYWTLYFDRYATSPSGITSVAAYTQYSTISTSCSGISWGQGYSNRKLTCTASYTYNGKTENFTLGTWTDGATSKSVTKSDFNFPADLNVTVKWTASTNIGSTSSTAQIRVKQTFPAPNLNNTTFTAESTAPYCIRVNVSGVDFGDNYSARKLELYGTYELDGIIYDNKLGEISNQTSWTLEYDASQEAEPWTKIPDDSSILLRLVADNGNRTSDKTIIINCQPSYEAYVIESIPEEEKEKSETYTGKNIQIQNASEGAPFSKLDLKGNTEQDGTPTPDAPVAVQTVTGENVVKICGKNLLGLTSAANITSNGVSSVWDGSHLAFSGTATSNQVFLSQYIENNYPAGNYKLSLASPAASRIIFRFFDSNNSTLKSFTIEAGSSSVAVTLDGTEAKFRFVMLASSGETYNHSYDFQLELGSTATAYEPYQGQSYEVNLGKNLFDKDNANIFNGYLGSSGIVEAANARAVYIPVVAGQTYTFSRANSTSQVNDPYYAFIANEPVGGGQYLEGRHAVGQHDLTFTGTAPAGSKYLIFYFAWNPSAETLATILSTYQLELGSTPTSYAAYFEPIELCGLGDDGEGGYLYKDGIYKNLTDNKWYVHKETGKRTYTADDITIAASDTYSNVRYAQFPKGADNKQYGSYTYGGIINFFTHGINMGATPAGGWNSYISDGLIYNSAMQDNYWCSFAKSTTLATMKEKLNGMVAYYVLATPTDTEITNEALIEQLEAILSQGYTYAGTNNITTVISAGNAQGELEIQYYTKWQNTSPAILSANGRNGTGNFKQIRRIGTK